MAGGKNKEKQTKDKKEQTIRFLGDDIAERFTSEGAERAMELMDLYMKYYGKENDKTYVVAGSKIGCSYGVNLTRIGVMKDHAVYDENGNAVLTCSDCVEGENIFNFGVCCSAEALKKDFEIATVFNSNTKENVTGPKCRMILTPVWLQDWNVHTHIWNSEKHVYEPVLRKDAAITCLYGEGVITIKEITCSETVKEKLYKVLDAYLQGNVSDDEAEQALKRIAGDRILNVYKVSWNTNDYGRYDAFIIGWTEYFNDRLGEWNINPEIIKAIMWRESTIGYSSVDSPNKNPKIDVMQVLDPRNPTIYEFCSYPLDTTKNVRVLNKEGNYVLPVELDPAYKQCKTRSTYNTPVADRLFKDGGDGFYYYQYQNATVILSIAFGIKTYSIKLKAAEGDELLAAQKYNDSDIQIEYREAVRWLVYEEGYSKADEYKYNNNKDND